MGDGAGEHEAAVDELYGLPLDEFTAARDALAKRLRGEGEAGAAAEVKQLRKPSVSAWALNQVRRHSRDQTDQLIEAGEQLREGQERLLAGGGREGLQQAAADERRLVDELTRDAELQLVAAGRAVSPAVQDKMRSTLHAIASDDEARDRFAAGRLVRDHEAAGLGPLMAIPGAPAPAKRAGKKHEKAPPRPDPALERRIGRVEERLEQARLRRRELDQERKETQARLRRAQRAASQANAELERAEKADKSARKHAGDAADAVAKLERELRELGGT